MQLPIGNGNTKDTTDPTRLPFRLRLAAHNARNGRCRPACNTAWLHVEPSISLLLAGRFELEDVMTGIVVNLMI